MINIGTFVRVKEDAEQIAKEEGKLFFNPLMREYLGQAYEIKDIVDDKYYLLDCPEVEGLDHWHFLETWLEPYTQCAEFDIQADEIDSLFV